MKNGILFLLFIFIQSFFAQTTYYVKTDGNDANNGLSWGTAKATIQAAYNASTVNDVILVKYGTYHLASDIQIDANRKITSDDGTGSTWNNAHPDYNSCILDALPDSLDRIIQFNNSAVTNNCVIRGFKFTGTIENGAGIMIFSGSNPIIEECWFYYNTARGIYVASSQPIIRRNIFEHNNTGVDITNSNGLVKVINNLIMNSDKGIYARSSSEVNSYNNTFISNGSVVVIQTTTTFRLTNCVCANNDWITYNNGNDHNIVSFRNCNFFNNNQNTYYGTGGISKTDITFDDPEFVGTGNHPYSLKATSPLVNGGDSLTTDDIGSSDILGNNRFYNTYEDIGAYEFQGEPENHIVYRVPADNATFANTTLTEITIDFNRKMFAAGGNFSLYSEGGTLVKSIASNSSDVTINAKKITIRMDVTLTFNTDYYITIANNAFEDNVGVNFAGISNNTGWNFSVGETDGFGGNCLTFDGIDDYVNLGNTSVYRPANNLTVEMWVYYDNWDISGTEMFASNSEADGGYNLQNNEGTLKFIVFHGAQYKTAAFDGSSLSPGWHHIAGTTDGDWIKLYVDGEVKGTYDNWYDESIEYNRANSLILGAEAGNDNYPTGEYFSGKMDEIRIWNSCRTEQQFRETMFKTLAGNESNLLAYFQCNSSTSTSLSDRANGKEGILVNMNNEDWVESEVPISDGNYVYQTINDAYTGNIDLSLIDLMMDVNSKSGTTKYLIIKHETTPSSNPANVNRTYDRQYWIIHQFSTGSYDVDLNFTIEEDVTPAMEDNPGAVKLYYRASTSSGDWTLVKSAASCNAANNSILFNNVTQTGQFIICRFAGPAQNIAGTMLNFNGSNAYVSGYGIPTDLTQLTLEAWVYPRSLPEEVQRFITLKNEIAVLRYDGTLNGGPGEIHFYIKTNGTLKSLRTENVLSTGMWNHVAGTWDGTTMKIYLNGEMKASSTPGGTLDAGNGDFNLSSSGESFDGYMDEARIHSRALTEQEIRESMHLTLSGYESNLVTYWQMNDGAGESTTDEVVSGCVGTLNNMDINSDWIASAVPVGSGSSNTQTEATGVVNYTSTNLLMNYSSHDGASVTVSKINHPPNSLPGEIDAAYDDQYWVVNRYGTGYFNATLTFAISEDFSAEDIANPLRVKLYSRQSNSDGEWQFLKRASSLNASEKQVTFSGVTSFSQFVIVSKSDLPEVSTDEESGIDLTSAICGGNVTEAYGTTVTARGVCWSTISPPTIADSHTSDGTGTGTFESSISGLTKNTKYYVRAYATNSIGSNYGEEKSFVTPNQLYNMIDFDGWDDYVSASFTYPTQGTIEFWFKAEELSSGYFWSFCPPDTYINWYCGLSNGDLMSYIGGTGSSVRVSGINSNQWYHCAISWIKALQSVTFQLYLNGNLEATQVNSWVEPSGDLFIGARYDNINGHYAHLDGQMEEFRIWNVVKNADEIRNNMHQFINPSSSNLILYYDFNSSSGTITSDRTSNGHNGILTNMTNSSWVTSTAPIGVYGTQVRSTTQTSAGQSGKTITATVSNGDGTNYLGLFTYGDGDASIGCETFPEGIIQRTNFIWGVKEFGSCTANLVFDYSGIVGTSVNESVLKLIKRSDASGIWTDMSSIISQNTTAHTFTLTGITDYSEFSIGDASENPLPVELSSFTASTNENEVMLRWKTETEVDNYGFEIQRSLQLAAGGLSWKMLGFVEGNGNSNSPKEYFFEDKSVESGKHLYRLKQIDTDGQYKYSNEIEVEVKILPMEFSLSQNYPNPFNPVTTIKYSIPKTTLVQLKVYNLLGREVVTLVNEINGPGYYKIDLNGESLSSGVYFYCLNADRIKLIKKLVLIK